MAESATLTQARRGAFALLGTFDAGTATATANNTAGQLECLSHPFKDSVLSSSYWKDKYLLRPDAVLASDGVRFIASATPATGLITPTLGWTNPPTSEAFEVWGLPFDPLTKGPDYINAALKRCMLVREFTLTPVPNQTRYTLAAAAPWVLDPAWVLGVGYLAAGESRLEVEPFRRALRGEATADGSTVYLTVPAQATTSTVYVRAFKRAYDDCRPAAGAFGDQSGLSLESDAAPVAVDWLKWAAVLEVLDDLDAMATQGDGRAAEALRRRAAARFTARTREFVRPPQATFRRGTLAGAGPGW